MKCDDVLPALEIGDVTQKWAARRHARDCPACAAAIGRWRVLKSSLAVAPVLTDNDRLIWREARRELCARRRLPRNWVIGMVAIVASVVVVLLWPRHVPVPTAAPPIEALAFSAERAEKEFVAFDRQLDQIDNELAALSNRIAIADAKRKAEDLMDLYRH